MVKDERLAAEQDVVAQRRAAERAAWAALIKVVGLLILGAVGVWVWFTIDQAREDACLAAQAAHNEIAASLNQPLNRTKC